MLATLERPVGRTISPRLIRTSPPVSSQPALARLRLLGPVGACPATSLPALSPLLPAVSDPHVRRVRSPVPSLVVSTLPGEEPAWSAPGRRGAQTTSTTPLRMTARARRLLAGLALLCCIAVGVVAVDVLSAVVPFTPSDSYAAQERPYVGPSGRQTGSGGLVPSAGSSITVGAGDTLWSLADQVDPDADPRDVIAAIMSLNELSSPTLQPGQVLRLP